MGMQYVEQMIEDPAGREQRVVVNIGESPLAWLHARGHLSERHYRAGELLRADWEKAGMAAQVTMRWDAAPPQGGRRGAGRPADPTMRQLAARDRFHAAIAAAGPGLSDILWRVACAGEGLVAAERALGWPSRAGKLVLTLALDRVADWYRVG
ncbi:hypothetical protein L288_05820 [Sphingobium quisquiliarum P25]|uniref:DUF6456 domain-containing protein n=1 Tax=Sphingobium quisquiliarum P25 TaxID=1329909 RepID=T0ICJ6_9SPHN|nr:MULTISPECIES: DUF6456 domain-containing protein [Sphingobium]EQB09405.1 hypothetical protein L288_05820 [Sphingobium quisquiliarum P25]EZP69951.1 hypothetical protein BV96_03811 [Sphingomonas paucimobilis]